MADWKLPMEGGCRCGKVRFRVTAPPMFTAVCHCTGCQKMSGSAYSTTMAVPVAAFELTQGETVIGGMHDERLHHQHCDWCKSWVYTTFEPATGFYNVRATMLDDPAQFAPFIELYTSEALPWARIEAAHSYAQFPPPADYPKILGEFAAL